ncbi:MAG: bifunctional 3-(3-hydroxy-phenyl)propionate/3-hydroxycinnamic acid hydroxylase [Pseudomonadales bacterium]|nr:bifunctional 3-(3-hydroxy-phenyl)propionate/3-hydroxycinnamic acid hydroxylase [Pseudomonadales bacterium]
MRVTVETVFDVAIVGLGPVGCFGAILLAEAGLKVVCLEKESEVYTLPRAVNLDGEIIRALQAVDLAETVNAMMQPLRPGERAGFANSKREWLFGVAASPSGSHGWQPSNMFDQPELEQFFRDKTLEHQNVTTFIGYEVTEFEIQPEQVTLSAEDDAQNIVVAAKFMIACDGANSPTRKALQIPWRDLGYDQDWLVVDVVMTAEHDLANEVLQICDPDRIHTYVATKEPFRRWEFQLNPGETADQMLKEDTITKLLDPWVPRDTYTLRRTAVYQFHAAVAATWRRERVLLAGDAAHQTPPFLGQGMNAGMRDLINLAWKLPLVLNQICAETLLDTYPLERAGHAHDLVSWAVSMGHLMTHLAATEAAERAGKPAPAPPESMQTSGYGQGREQPPIRSGAVMTAQLSDQGITGYLLSQPMVKVGSDKPVRFDTLLGAGFALIFHGDVELSAASQAVVDHLSIRLVNVAAMETVKGRFADVVLAGETVLVRPDKVVFGHTSDAVKADDLLTALKNAMPFC